MDLQKAIRISIETGKTMLGSKQGKILALKGGAKLLLISGNCPKDMKEEIIYAAGKSNTPYYETSLTSMEIGSVCGKPFPVSVLSVIEPGNSDILKLTEKGVVVETVKEEKETRASMMNKSREKKAKKERKSEEEGSGTNEGENPEAE